jgi:hypothetical protein
LVERAFAHFKRSGELPEFDRLAQTVVERALAGESAADIYYRESQEYYRAVARATGEDLGVPQREPDDIRRQLFWEALRDDVMERYAARELLKVFVKIGIDPTKPLPFNDELSFPEYGSLGLHLLDWPHCLIRPPFEDRARRVVEKIEELRGQVHALPNWRERLEEAVAEFEMTRELPEDEVLREVVLADHSLRQLMTDVVALDTLLA